MAESTLTSTYEDIRVVAGLEMGWGRDPDAHWTTTNNTDFGIACKEGYRQFLYPIALPGENKSHNWSFLYPMGSLNLIASETSSSATETVLASSSPLTLPANMGGVYSGNGTYTFPSWVEQGAIEVEGSIFEVYAVNNDLDLAIVRDWNDTDRGTETTSFTVHRLYYNMPDDFGGMASDTFTYARDEQWHLPQIKIVGEAEIRKVDRANDGNVYPRYASLTPVAPSDGNPVTSLAGVISTSYSSTPASGTRWRVRFYPLPEQAYRVEYRYHAIPPALDDTTNIYHYGGAEHSQTIMASVIDALYRRVRSSNEKQEEFMGRLRQSILHDRRNYNTGNLGQKLNYSTGKDALRGFRESTPTGNITTTFY